jgi:HEAT repeat protein
MRMATLGVQGGRPEECLHLLARALQQLHTYPSSSPFCHDAVGALHDALTLLDRHDHLDFRVAPHELTVDDKPVGRGTLIDTELARRLHAAGITQVTITRGATARELTQLCLDLLICADQRQHRLDLSELLAEHGVSRITVRAASRPEVLVVGTPTPAVAARVDGQRARRGDAVGQSAAMKHLYPPEKGWVRLDPAATFPSLSLLDLALLVEDPATLARMLLRLTSDDVDGQQSPQAALAQKFSDVATIFGAADPAIARVMFARLARAVLEMEPEARQTLLRRTILPGLLDGRPDGEVLKNFPEIDLAESLCLLLDLETAAPAVVIAALSRLDLPPERHNAVLPLIEEQLHVRAGGERRTTVELHARRLVTVDVTGSKCFTEFSAFDLRVDEQTAEVLSRIRDGIADADTTSDRIGCVWNLVRLEANPELVDNFMRRAAPALDRLAADGRWVTFADWLSRFRDLAVALSEARPEVSRAVSDTLRGLCGVDRAQQIVTLATRNPEGLALAGDVILALGPEIGPGLAAAALGRSDGAGQAATRVAQQLLCEHAALVAPAVVDALATADPLAARSLIRALGIAGTGYEAVITTQLASPDRPTVREALRALARIGTPQAAASVRLAVTQPRAWVSSAAADTIWQFPPDEAQRQALTLLGARDFVKRRPQVAVRLLDRAAQNGPRSIQPVLARLVPLRYRVWSPAVARVGRRARVLLHP